MTGRHWYPTVLAALALLGAPAAGRAQVPARLGAPVVSSPVEPPPGPAAGHLARGGAPAADPGPGPVVPLTLSNALRLALLANLDVRQSEEVVNQARAALRRADVAWIPNLGLGTTYSKHEGKIQKTEGNVINVNRDALFVGGGPAMNVQVSDAIFGPLLVRHQAAAAGAGLRRVSNDTLLAVADAYLNVLRARRRIARADETLEYLTSSTAGPLRAGSKGLLPLVQDFVEVGRREALRSDLARVEVEVLRRREERRAAVQELVTAQAELARLLRLDPRTPLWPAEDFRRPMPIPVGEWADQPPDVLVATALRNRPELAENQALVEAAVERVRMARYRPLLPNLTVGYNFGGFGGGPDPNPPLLTPPSKPGGAPKLTNQPGFGPSGRILNFGPRTDLDASVYWRLQNFGLGNYAELREQQAVERQAVLRLAQAQDRVATQVVQAGEQLAGWRDRLAVTRAALFDPAGEPGGPVFRSVRLNFERIRGAEGRPLEALDAIRSLNDTLEAYGQAVTEYERSHVRLLLTLGMPAPTILSLFCPPPAAPAAGGPKAQP